VDRVGVTDERGVPLLSYLPGRLDHRPAAEEVELLDGAGPEHAARLLVATMPGWVVSGPDALLDALISLGARVRRHAHVYSWDLRADPPPAEWADQRPPSPLRVAPAAGRPAEDLLAAARSAYPAGHVDDVRDPFPDLRDILAGSLVGPLLNRSEVMLAGHRVVAALLLSDSPTDGPWVSEVFRQPGPAYAGLGSVLLRRGLAHLAADDRTSLGLAVTAGNPARARYEGLGFRLVAESRTVFVPERSEPAGGNRLAGRP
jgi:hypothetical protein